MIRGPVATFVAQHRDFAAFVAVGLFMAVVYFACIAFLLELLGADYRVAVTAAYLLSLVCHFLANRLLTFRRSDGHLHLQVIKYAVMVGANYLTTMGIVIGTVNLLNGSPYLGALLAIAANLLLNYFVSKYWIFTAPWLRFPGLPE